MSEFFDDSLKNTKVRAATVRLRTWSSTLAIFVAIILYILVSVTMNQSINWVDFVFLCVVQLLVYTLYFPDGDLFGQKDTRYILNRDTYNRKATLINENREIAKLRKYCKVDFEERKQRYILYQLGKLNISLEEYSILRGKTEEEIKQLKTFESIEIVNGEEKSRLFTFSRHKRKILYNLLFKPLPVEENHPETIMSAVENNGINAIKDKSKGYKAGAYISKAFKAIVLGGFLAYIGWTMKDGIGLAEIVKMVTYITTIFTTAVTAFTSGEKCSKVYRSLFYLELSNFIDGFEEWNNKKVEVINEENSL